MKLPTITGYEIAYEILVLAFSVWFHKEFHMVCHIDGLVQERRNSIANALELRLSCTNPSIWSNSGDFQMNKPSARSHVLHTLWGRQDPGGPHVGPMNFASGTVVVSL